MVVRDCDIVVRLGNDGLCLVVMKCAPLCWMVYTSLPNGQSIVVIPVKGLRISFQWLRRRLQSLRRAVQGYVIGVVALLALLRFGEPRAEIKREDKETGEGLNLEPRDLGLMYSFSW